MYQKTTAIVAQRDEEDEQDIVGWGRRGESGFSYTLHPSFIVLFFSVLPRQTANAGDSREFCFLCFRSFILLSLERKNEALGIHPEEPLARALEEAGARRGGSSSPVPSSPSRPPRGPGRTVAAVAARVRGARRFPLSRRKSCAPSCSPPPAPSAR